MFWWEHLINFLNQILSQQKWENMPIEYQKSFNEVKKLANEDGYHKFQLHFFMDIFGKQGMALADLIDLNILFSTSQLSNVSEEIK